MTHKTVRLTIMAAAFAGVASGAQAATSYTWDLMGTDTSCVSGCANTSNTRVYKSTVGNVNLTARALYSVVTNGLAAGSATENAVLASTFRSQQLSSSTAAAQLGQFGDSGMGVANPIDISSGNTHETSTNGHHAVDNYGISGNANRGMDFLLFDFGQVMTPESFQIGWKGSDSDMDFLLGPANASAVSLTNADGTSNGTTVQSLLNAGWTRLSKNDVPDCVPTISGCPVSFGYAAGKQGRYLIAAGALGGTNDAFKFSQITMQMSSGGSAPIPGTAALLGIGVLGIAWSRRRSLPVAA